MIKGVLSGATNTFISIQSVGQSAMAKRVIGATESFKDPTFGMSLWRRRVACDDGSTYVFERAEDTPRWRCVRRIDSQNWHKETDTAITPSRLPAAVHAHMRGHLARRRFYTGGDDYLID